MKRAYIDVEFNRSHEAKQNLVSCVVLLEEPGRFMAPVFWWLDKNEERRTHLKEYLKTLRDEGFVLVCFSATAEASSLIALNLDPTKFKWIDLQAEWKMLLNHSNKWAYGAQLIDGKPKKTKPPRSKWERTEEEAREDDNSKAEKSLVACAYKLLGVNLDLAHKNEMRDLIISEPATWTDEQKAAVLQYNVDDVKVLPKLYRRFVEIYREDPARHAGAYSVDSILWRGESVARAALIEKHGYPVNREKVTRLAASIPKILADISDDVNRQFPEMGIFHKNRDGTYTMKQKPLKDWIQTTPYAAKWMKTDGGQPSLALDAFTRHYSFSHDFPEGNVAAQVIRFLKTKQNFNGFLPKKSGGRKRKSFFDFYADDGRARCYLNPYGSQSSRFQPMATGFIPLKSAWMRSMIEPRPGFSVASIDYGSEEFLLAAMLSGDKAMFESYVSGDPYLDFAKKAKAIPPDGTKDSHPVVRQRFKSTVLGIGYLMGAASLADKISQDTKIPTSVEEAEHLIELYFSVYHYYAAWIDRTIQNYYARGYLILPDGWVMHGDNQNRRSISNCPVQGVGACILRRAIQIGQDRGVKVVIPLHDALDQEYRTSEPEKIDVLASAMMEAFGYYFQKDPKIFGWSQAVRLDFDAWGPDHVDGHFVTPGGRKVKTQKIFVDPRGKAEYERFKVYL
jgi:hypothetical protein